MSASRKIPVALIQMCCQNEGNDSDGIELSQNYKDSSAEVKNAALFKLDVSVTDVIKYVQEMKSIYDTTNGMTWLNLYSYLLYVEEEYAYRNFNRNNLAFNVHKLHSLRNWCDTYSKAPETSIRATLLCPFCQVELLEWVAFHVHILFETHRCSSCMKKVTFSLLTMSRFVAGYNAEKELFIKWSSKLGKRRPKCLKIPSMIDTWDSFALFIKSQIIDFQEDDWELISACVKQFSLSLSPFNLDFVKEMYWQLLFIHKICSHYYYWLSEDVIAQAIARYHKFICLMQDHPRLLPTLDIVLVWQARQLHVWHPRRLPPHKYCAFFKRCTQIWTNGNAELDAALTSNDINFANTCFQWHNKFSEVYSVGLSSCDEINHSINIQTIQRCCDVINGLNPVDFYGVGTPVIKTIPTEFITQILMPVLEKNSVQTQVWIDEAEHSFIQTLLLPSGKDIRSSFPASNNWDSEKDTDCVNKDGNIITASNRLLQQETVDVSICCHASLYLSLQKCRHSCKR